MVHAYRGADGPCHRRQSACTDVHSACHFFNKVIIHELNSLSSSPFYMIKKKKITHCKETITNQIILCQEKQSHKVVHSIEFLVNPPFLIFFFFLLYALKS